MSDQAPGTYPMSHAVNSQGDSRSWNMDMSAVPHDRMVEVVGRLPSASAGFPQYALRMDDDMYAFSHVIEPYRIICWAWRERTDWPDEPRS
jgi:hypothetical protein